VLTVSKLSKAYPTPLGPLQILDDIHFTLQAGIFMAIIGESGSGKSTLIDVIMGFNDPTSGDILIDDTPLKKYDINSYREKIGYVPQGGDLFNASITQNIKWANEKATNEQIQHMCKEAYADSFIKSFPEGYETLVGDRGIRLSGGQLQRIALARALIRKPEILILDEATSSVDTETEILIQKAIQKLLKGRTSIVIAHRLSTIQNSDKIIVLHKGEIKEVGTHQELLSKRGIYFKLYQLQYKDQEVGWILDDRFQ